MQLQALARRKRFEPEFERHIQARRKIVTGMRETPPAAAFAAAPHVYHRRFTTGRHTGVPMEPRGLVADAGLAAALQKAIWDARLERG